MLPYKKRDPLETEDLNWAERVRFKSTLDFVKQMESYIEHVPNLIFEAKDYTFGRFSVTADWIEHRFITYKSYPIKKRLAMIAHDIYEQFHSDNFMGDEIPRVKAILKSLNTMLNIKNTTALYQHFYEWIERPHLMVFPKKLTLEWSDVFPFLYLYGFFEGLKESRGIKHLVIDEMQDYPPIQYAVINQIFPCQKTILGDFGQFLNLNHLHSLKDLQELYTDASTVELNKSYRSTYEIITFAKEIGQISSILPMERHGDVPKIMYCPNRQEEMKQIKENLKGFLEGNSVSIGIILKTNSAAKELYDSLKQHHNIQLITPDSTQFTNGISITSVQMSKGLEFDEVIIADVDEDTYSTEYDRKLLYIACTRAMHKLTLLHTGKLPHFFPDSNARTM